MRSDTTNVAGSGPVAVMADRPRVRACASYLSSRWVQAPIPDRREADT
jgi:hypothetical protein